MVSLISWPISRTVRSSVAEFLASTDNWFRPTMTKTGPDGALYVADIYRLVIEHPEWIPQEWQNVILGVVILAAVYADMARKRTSTV